MSTNITGFVIADGTDLFAFSRKVRSVFLPLIQQKIYNGFLEKMINSYDMMTYSPATMTSFRNENGIDGKQVNFYRIWSAAQKQQREDVSEMPNEYQVRISFTQDPETNKILGIWSGSHENYQIFKEFPEVKDFSYWDSSEGPSGISPSEWRERGRAWNRSLLPSGNISASCLVYTVAAPHELSSNISFIEMKNRGAKVPDMNWRIGNLAGYFILQEWVSADNNPLTNYSGMTDALSNPENISAWRKLVKEDISPKEIDFDTLQDFLDSRKLITSFE